jgi:hypothetical protein
MRNGERGSVLFVAAALLVTLVGLVLLLADLGLRLEARERLARATDAAALAGALSLCDRDAETVARAVANENAAGLGALDVAVELGALDPAGELVPDGTPSAIRVVSSASVPALFSGGVRPARAAGTAALRRFGVVSLAPDGEVRLLGLADQGGAFLAGGIHANGDVVIGGPPALDTAALSAAGRVLAGSGPVSDPWTGAVPVTLPRSASGVAPLRVPPLDLAAIAELRARATVVYTPGSPLDTILYGVGVESFTPLRGATETFGATFHFDLTDVSALGERPVIFFDAPETLGGERAAVSLRPRSGLLGHGTPNDPSGATRGLVFVATVPVIVVSGKSSLPGTLPDPFGGEGGDSVLVYGASDVFVRSQIIDFEGAVIRAGRDVALEASSSLPRATQRIRLIADRDVQIVDTNGVYDLGAGPPCPPAVAHAVRPTP